MSEVERLRSNSGTFPAVAHSFVKPMQDHWLSVTDECLFMKRLATLTDMQMLVLSLIAQGKFNKQIAFCCRITEATVKAHVSELLKRLGVHSRTEAAVKFTIIYERMRMNHMNAAEHSH